MLYPIKVIDVELSNPLLTLTGLENFMFAQVLVRLHGKPIGYTKSPIINGCISAEVLKDLIIAEHSSKIIQCLLENGLAAPEKKNELCVDDLFDIKPIEPQIKLPFVSVVVCTRDRTADLVLCLDAICQLEYPHLEILVIDNAPSTDATKQLIETHYPHVRYFHEPRPGLNWARNRAIIEAKGEIIAYTDDDVVVDSGWVKALGVLFAENPEIMAVTGLVVPYELETEAQVLFEKYGGFGRGFDRKWYKINGSKVPWQLLGSGRYGTGANMAYRSNVFASIGYFDPALDVGTATNGGGDLEMFFRVLKERHVLVYEPNAIVRHRHRRTIAELKYQVANNSKGLVAYFMRSIQSYPEEKYSFFKIWFWYLQNWVLKRLILSYTKSSLNLCALHKAELAGCFSFNLFKKARKNADKIDKQFKEIAIGVGLSKPLSQLDVSEQKEKSGIAVRSIDLSQPLLPLTDITNYSNVRVYLHWNGTTLGHLNINNQYEPIGVSRFTELVVKLLGTKLLQPSLGQNESILWAVMITALKNHYSSTNSHHLKHIEKLNKAVSVSVVIATYDRPDDLMQCLESLVHQESSREIEIIVVDNHPASGLTPPVVAHFPGVKLVNETRKGLSYARNAGINASQGDIILSTDDDVIIPANWIESLIAPFSRSDIMIVTGNVLPYKLEITAQQFFEIYGGLGRGYHRREYNGEWFESFNKHAVPTWNLGACANAAFRASIFEQNKVGMIEETLGAGMPTGCSEDTYVFYKVLRLGYTLVYEPNAYVWHKHRNTMKAFRRQLYNYSKGHVSYHLKAFLDYKDWRGLPRIFIELPRYHLHRIFKRILRRTSYPISLVMIEIAGNIAGPWALYKSWLRVKREGRSASYRTHNQGYSNERSDTAKKKTVNLNE